MFPEKGKKALEWFVINYEKNDHESKGTCQKIAKLIEHSSDRKEVIQNIPRNK